MNEPCKKKERYMKVVLDKSEDQVSNTWIFG